MDVLPFFYQCDGIRVTIHHLAEKRLGPFDDACKSTIQNFPIRTLAPTLSDKKLEERNLGTICPFPYTLDDIYSLTAFFLLKKETRWSGPLIELERRPFERYSIIQGKIISAILCWQRGSPPRRLSSVGKEMALLPPKAGAVFISESQAHYHRRRIHTCRCLYEVVWSFRPDIYASRNFIIHGLTPAYVSIRHQHRLRSRCSQLFLDDCLFVRSLCQRAPRRYS